MTDTAARLARFPLTVLAIATVLLAAVPYAMTVYAPYIARPGIQCVRTAVRVTSGAPYPAGMCATLADLYRVPAIDLLVDSTLRSLALIIGAALLALMLGISLGVAMALWRRHSWRAGGIVAATTLLSAAPAFFIAYFLQILVVILGATNEGGKLLPVFGFGYDSHLVLPLLSVAAPALAFTAQFVGSRMGDVLDADYITAARARGLPTVWILRTHVEPHVRSIAVEALSSGLRVSVASLPIVEYLFEWRGIGQLAFEAVAVHDATVLVATGVLLTTFFTCLALVADLSRPRALYRMA